MIQRYNHDMKRTSGIAGGRKSMVSSFLFILPVLIITGLLLALIVNFLHGKFSGRLIKISVVNSLALSGGVLLNLFITRMLVVRIKPVYVVLISFGFIAAVSVSGFLFILILEPFFFLYGARLIQSYLLINFVFALSLTVISSGFLVYQHRLMEKESVIGTERLLRKEIEQKLYNAKIHPHFLFNSLNLIVSMLGEPEKAEEALTILSELLRYHLDESAAETVPLSKEMENVKKYLALQKMRFGERLSFLITGKAEGVVPPLVIQPIVENAVKHNIKTVKHLHVDISINAPGDTIAVSVADSAGLVSESMIGKGSGLSITKRRTELAGGRFSIDGGAVIMTFPQSMPPVRSGR